MTATLTSKCRLLASSLVVALLAGPAVATASVIQFEMSGVINDTSGVVTPIPGIAVGVPWHVDAEYSGEVTDPGQVSPGYVTYQLLNYTLSIGSGISVTIVPSAADFQRQTVRLDIGRLSRLTGSQYELFNFLEIVASNYSSGGGGASLPITPAYTVDGRKLNRSFVALEGPAGQLWGLDNRLANALDYSLDDYTARRFVVTFRDDRTTSTRFESAIGTVEQYRVTVVPVAPSGLLFLSALTVFAPVCRRSVSGLRHQPKSRGITARCVTC